MTAPDFPATPAKNPLSVVNSLSPTPNILERLNRDILALKEVRKNLENKVSVLIGTLESTEGELGKVRDLSKELKAKIADESERTLLVQEKLNKRDIRLKELLQSTKTAEESLLEEKKLSKNYQNKVSLIGEQLKQLRIQLAALNQALEATESKNKEQKTQIVNLGKRLNAALATRVQELARYRSEFFGRLRDVLAQRGRVGSRRARATIWFSPALPG